MGDSLRADGVRAVLYDLRVRRMLDRWRTPVTAIVPAGQVAPGDLDRLSALARADNLLSSLVLMGDGDGEPATARRSWWPITRRSVPGLLAETGENGTPGIRPIHILLPDPRRLLDHTEVVRYLSWVHFEDGNDLTVIDDYPDILACSDQILRVLLESGSTNLEMTAEAFPGFRVRRVSFDPSRYSFDHDLFPDPLPGDVAFREVVEIYARLSTERLLYANAESRLRQVLADRERDVRDLADRLRALESRQAPSIANPDRSPWSIFRKNR
jgi:hypothetical protein